MLQPTKYESLIDARMFSSWHKANTFHQRSMFPSSYHSSPSLVFISSLSFVTKTRSTLSDYYLRLEVVYSASRYVNQVFVHGHGEKDYLIAVVVLQCI